MQSYTSKDILKRAKQKYLKDEGFKKSYDKNSINIKDTFKDLESFMQMRFQSILIEKLFCREMNFRDGLYEKQHEALLAAADKMYKEDSDFKDWYAEHKKNLTHIKNQKEYDLYLEYVLLTFELVTEEYEAQEHN